MPDEQSCLSRRRAALPAGGEQRRRHGGMRHPPGRQQRAGAAFRVDRRAGGAPARRRGEFGGERCRWLRTAVRPPHSRHAWTLRLTERSSRSRQKLGLSGTNRSSAFRHRRSPTGCPIFSAQRPPTPPPRHPNSPWRPSRPFTTSFLREGRGIGGWGMSLAVPAPRLAPSTNASWHWARRCRRQQR